MASEKRIAKQDNRGGVRPGAGRPAKVLSEEFKSALRDAMERKAKDTGISFHQMIVDLAWDTRLSMRERVQLIKIIKETMTVKESHQTIDKKELHAVVMLPPVQPAPARLVEGAGPVIDAETGEVVE